MAPVRQLATDSRIVKAPIDRLRVAKLHLQTSNNTQMMLRTMFEEVLQKLIDTKSALTTIQYKLENTRSALVTIQKELETSKADVEVTKSELVSTQQELETAKQHQNKTTMSLNRYVASYNRCTIHNADLCSRISQIEHDLQQERNKVEAKNDAQQKLDQVQGQWSGM
ncbi:hypothetical protein EJ02DRAFT_425992 [Clathrospora elynae]|uniref:Uncharacterized protein n=1 Tax=Clathrospora elynae TaxID=706981 RepID=A0A6A5SBY2_9PLEO|nr:hypothetical protein EJ02DRAFT_425992 [Clathrospora elynae]